MWTKVQGVETGVSMPAKNQELGKPGGGLLGAKPTNGVAGGEEDPEEQSSGAGPTQAQLLLVLSAVLKPQRPQEHLEPSVLIGQRPWWRATCCGRH